MYLLIKNIKNEIVPNLLVHKEPSKTLIQAFRLLLFLQLPMKSLRDVPSTLLRCL